MLTENIKVRMLWGLNFTFDYIIQFVCLFRLFIFFFFVFSFPFNTFIVGSFYTDRCIRKKKENLFSPYSTKFPFFFALSLKIWTFPQCCLHYSIHVLAAHKWHWKRHKKNKSFALYPSYSEASSLKRLMDWIFVVTCYW